MLTERKGLVKYRHGSTEIVVAVRAFRRTGSKGADSVDVFLTRNH
jgi:hypothetical protein